MSLKQVLVLIQRVLRFVRIGQPFLLHTGPLFAVLAAVAGLIAFTQLGIESQGLDKAPPGDLGLLFYFLSIISHSLI